MPQAVVAALVKIGTLIVGSLNAAYLGYKTVAIIGAVTVAGSVAAAKRLFAIELPKVDTDGSRQRTVKSTTEAQKVIYGEALVSGPISYIGLKGTDNKDLYQVISLAGHEVNAITDVHFDSQVIANASIGGGSANGGAVSGIFSGYATINKHLGLTTETADSLLTAAFGPGTGTPTASQYTSNHRGDGIAYLAMKWTLDDDSAELWEKYSPQNVKALVQGKKVYDPRLDSTAGANPENTSYIVYQTNPVNCLIDYLMDDNYGMGIPADKINWPAAVTAANGCDVTVNVPGGTESRFTCNGVIFATDSHKKNIAKILSSMNGTLVYTNGKYVIKSGIYYNHSADLNEDDLTGAITVKTSFEGSDRFNTIKGLFIDPSQNHKSSEFPKVQLTDAVSRDNNKVLEKEIALNMTNTSYMAQRIANKLIQQSSQQQIINFPANLSAMRIAVGDRVRVTVSDLSWSNKIFECIGWTFSDDGGINLTLREDSDQAYADPDPSENEYSTITATGDITDAFRGVPSPSGLTATPGLKSNELNWVNPLRPADYGTIYVYASRNANFSSAVKIGETDGTQFVHDASNKSLLFSAGVFNVGDTYTIRDVGTTDFTAIGASANTAGVVFTATGAGSGTGKAWETIVPGNTRYYWVRAIKNVGTDAASQSNLEPISDPNTTVFATVGAVEVDWDNVADPTIGIDINNDTISINTGSATTTTGQDVAQSGISEDVTITQGGIRMNQGGSIRGGQTSYNSGEGFFLGYDSNKYKLSIRNSTSEALTFDGEDLSVTGAITATSGTFAGSVSVNSSGKMYGGTMSSFNTGAGFFLGYDTDAYKFSVGNSSSKVLTWDGDNLNVEANLVSFTTGNEQVYSSLSRLPPGVVSASRSLESNSDYFYFDSEIDVIQPSFVVSYNLGALTSGSISGQTNSRNAILSTIKLELFYATGSYAGTPGSWTLWDDSTFTSSTLGSGQPSMSANTLVVQQVDLGGGNWETKLLTRKEYREYANDDYYSASFTPNSVVDDEYYLNWRVQKANNIEWPAGARFLKVVATVTNGSYTPYPSTGSPSITETRIVSIPGGTLYEQENHGLAIALGGQGWDNATRYIGLRGQTVLSGGEVTIGSPRQNIGFPGDTAKLKLVGFDTDNGSIRNLSAIEFHNGLSTLNGSPEFGIYVPNAGNVLAFSGNVNFNSDVDVDGTLSINGVTVNAGAVTGPAGSDTQIQYNDGGSLGASSNFTFNDSTNTLTVQNLTVSGTTTTVNSANLTVKDPNITLNYATGDSSSTANNAGITIQDAVDASTDASILWKTASDSFEFSHPVKDLSLTGDLISDSSIYLRSAGGVAGVYLQDTSGGSASTAFRLYSDVDSTTVNIDTGGSQTIAAFVNNGNLLITGTIFADGAASNSLQWETGYDYSQVGHLPLAGGTLTGTLDASAGLLLSNTNITEVNALSFNDPGPNEGISWTSGNTAIFESPDNLTTNSAGNLQFVYGGTRRLTVNNTGIDVNGQITANGTISSGAITSTAINTGDATLLTLHHDTGSDVSQQKSFIDFSFEDDNTNETPQVRFGAEVGQNGDANSQIKEGSGAFVVYTNNATTTSGAATGLNERFRVDYVGDTWIKTGRLIMGGTTVIDTSRNLTNIGTISSGAINSSGIVLGGHGATPTGSVIGNVRSYGTAGAYMGASDESGRTAFFGVDSSGYSMFGSLTNHDTMIRANNQGYLRVKTNSNVQIVAGALQMGTTTVIDASRNLTNVGDITASGLATVSRLKTGLGSEGTPAIQVGDVDSGFWDSGANEIGVSLSGVLEYEFTPSQLDLKSNNLTGVGTIASGRQTITSSGTIGGTTVANGYLKITDGTDTLGFDANEIHTTNDLYILAELGNIIFRGLSNAGVVLKNGTTQFMDASRNLTNIGTISSGANSGIIKEIGGDISLVQGAVGLRINDAASALSATTASSNNDASVDLGVSNIRFRNLWLSGTISSGAITASSVNASGGFLNGSNGGIRIHTSGTKFFNVTAANVARDNIMDIGASDARFKDLHLAGTISSGAITSSGLVTADRFYSGVGTAASPAYQVGDTNSGFYDSGANEVGLSLSGVLEYEFTPTTFDMKNNLLTGVSQLTVGGGTSGTIARFRGSNYNQINISHSGNASWGMLLTNSNSTSNASYHYSTSGAHNSIAVVNVNNDALHFGTNNAKRMTIDHGGDVSVFADFTATGNVTAYSDERLKDNIKTLDGSKVLQMRGVSFTKDGKAGSGVIAQELELVASELVHTADDEMGTKSVAYGNLVGYLIENAKQQQNEIDELKALVKQLMEK